MTACHRCHWGGGTGTLPEEAVTVDSTTTEEPFDYATATDDDLAFLALNAAEAVFWVLVDDMAASGDQGYLGLGYAEDGVYVPLHQKSIKPAGWQQDHQKVAGAKGAVVARTGLSMREVVTNRRDLLVKGDVEELGGVPVTVTYLDLDGTTVTRTFVGISDGIQPVLNEFLAKVLTGALAHFLELRTDALKDAA
jgi:hypothetical protein